MSKNLNRLYFIILDLIISSFSWAVFYILRKHLIEGEIFKLNNQFFIGISIVPLFWFLIYLFQGTYYDVRRLYRLKIINLTIVSSIIGSIFLFFFLLLDDSIPNYKFYYSSFILLFSIQFSLSLISRFIFISILVSRIQNSKVGFRTLLIGGKDKANTIYNEIIQLPKSIGNNFVGFVRVVKSDYKNELDDKLENLGSLNNLSQLLSQHRIEEVIIALEKEDYDLLKNIVSLIERTDVKIKISPDMYDILLGAVRMNNLFGALLYEVNTDAMPPGQRILKRLIDFFISLFSLIILLPFYFIMAVIVKTSSTGPIFYLQERIGIHGKPFKIIKFRTMYVDAEKFGPQLSSENDPRITKIGKFMRKFRIDEFPQFLNVLKGDMSLVGPRPERQFYIDQISKLEPQFLQLNKVRPGITSWGQVKFGYAENIEQMIQRMKFDLLYINNRSLSLDFKIMIYTIFIILKAKGK
jgi:exopolysaccharide biosynthesis polyprenyl glycosylphosphotransferase